MCNEFVEQVGPCAYASVHVSDACVCVCLSLHRIFFSRIFRRRSICLCACVERANKFTLFALSSTCIYGVYYLFNDLSLDDTRLMVRRRRRRRRQHRLYSLHWVQCASERARASGSRVPGNVPSTVGTSQTNAGAKLWLWIISML